MRATSTAVPLIVAGFAVAIRGLTPVATKVAVTAALILPGEPLTLPLVVSAVAILAGVFIAQRR